MWQMRFFMPVFAAGLAAVSSLSAQAPTPGSAVKPPPAPPPKAPVVPAELPPEIQTLQPGVKLTLLAEHPALVTPTGIDVDEKGQIWLVACHTHFRPEGYTGPAHDEVLIFDSKGGGRRVFYNKTDATMHLELGPDGWVYLAERDRILRVKDTDGDGRGDLEETLAALDTVADYPHNGLSGMAWHPDGGLVFSLGENFGKDWVLTARDGSHATGRGEGGVFRCTPGGEKLLRIARGFWNPFGLLVRRDGSIFAAENDPGSRPPCRLLHVVEGADYGFQWVYGSAPVHPFVAWNGELRGTLGMVHPCGEGPCAVVELGGGVMIPSWSNHCIDYFPLHGQGAGFTSNRVELLRGSDFFRPVCMAPGPDGAFYLTDWVFSSYPIHGRGRLWKLEVDRAQATWMQKQQEPATEAAILAAALRDGSAKKEAAELLRLAQGEDRWLGDAALTALARQAAAWTPEKLTKLPPQDRLWALVALRRAGLEDPRWVRALKEDADPEIQFERLRWIADAVLVEFMPEVTALLDRPDLDYRLFEAALATLNTLRGNPGAGVTDPALLLEKLTTADTPARVKAYALRLLPPDHPRLPQVLLKEFLQSSDALLAREAARSLVARGGAEARASLATLAANAARPAALRADAIPGLAGDAVHRPLLLKLADDKEPAVRSEALRALRFEPLEEAPRKAIEAIAANHADSATLAKVLLNPAELTGSLPALNDTDAWLRELDALPGKADPSAGRRLFSHPRLALCSACHRHSGRGVVLGPDLSLVRSQGDRAAVLRSILEPAREVAPQFFPTQLKLQDGSLFTGILLRSSNTEVYRDLTGKERVFQKADIVAREELRTSLMPAGLPMSLTRGELRDLLAFLMEGEPVKP